jgi:hypothetical protein
LLKYQPPQAQVTIGDVIFMPYFNLFSSKIAKENSQQQSLLAILLVRLLIKINILIIQC